MLQGAPITGESYVREKYGPLPRHALSVIEEAYEPRALFAHLTMTYSGAKTIRRFHSLRAPQKSYL